jgi:hypothetical protein
MPILCKNIPQLSKILFNKQKTKKTKIMPTVKVTTKSNDSTEILGISSNNPDFGYIRVEENGGLSFGAGGWLNSNTKTALIKGKVADLTAFIRKNNVTVGYEIPGKIVIKEQTTPFYEGQQPKRAGANGEVLYTTDSEGVRHAIYRQTEFTMNMDMQDVLVKHDNILSSAAKVVMQNDIAVK